MKIILLNYQNNYVGQIIRTQNFVQHWSLFLFPTSFDGSTIIFGFVSS